MTDREKLVELLTDCDCPYPCKSADYLIENGVAPVVHGYWVDHYICSNCGKWSTAGLDADVWTSYEPSFCPNCGARMDGDGDA